MTGDPGLPGARVPPRRHPGQHQGRHRARRRTSRAGGSASTAATPSPPACGRAASCRTSTASISSKITWVLSGDEHVAEYRPPANVVPIEQGKKMGDMLASGELAAAIGVEVDAPDVKPLIPNALEAGLAALRQQRPLSDQPHGGDQGRADRGASRSGRRRVQRLRRSEAPSTSIASRQARIEKPTEVDEVHRRVMEITGDPLPYGIAPNRRVIDELIGHALTQGIITKPVTAEELFVPSTRSWWRDGMSDRHPEVPAPLRGPRRMNDPGPCRLLPWRLQAVALRGSLESGLAP